MKNTAVLLLLLASVVQGLAAGQGQQQSVDTSFPGKLVPTYGVSAPRILYDDGHRNTFASDTRGRGLANLFSVDGAFVNSGKERFSLNLLRSYQVLVVSTALAPPNVPDAFEPSEVTAVTNWVRGGGGILVLADHYPFDRAMSSLLGGFGVSVGEGVVADATHYDKSSLNTWLQQKQMLEATFWLLFTRDNGLLRSHPVTDGRQAGERVDRILSFGGSSLSVPPGATAFLQLSASARPEHVPDQVRDDRPRLERAQGIALTFGAGKVVILADGSMLGAQFRTVNGAKYPYGMNRPDVGNSRLALNILHWLAPPVDRVR